MVCRFPSSSGFGWILKLKVGNQAIQWPGLKQGSVMPDSMRYALPQIILVSPLAHPTTGFNLTIRGQNFVQAAGARGSGEAPIVRIGSDNCTVFAFSPDEITCEVKPGQGVNLPLDTADAAIMGKDSFVQLIFSSFFFEQTGHVMNMDITNVDSDSIQASNV